MHKFVWIIILCLIVQACESRLHRYEDTLCALTGYARDPAEAHIWSGKRTQKCWLYAGPNTARPGNMLYEMVGTPTGSPPHFTWRINSASIEIDSSHLDMGHEANQNSESYIHLLDDSVSVDHSITLAGKPVDHSKSDTVAVTGMVLGAKLGGDGMARQNLFPQSSRTRPAYKDLEDKIYNCIKSGAAFKASLEWTFLYQTVSRTRPYSVWYHVRFFGENNVASTCADVELHFDN